MTWSSKVLVSLVALSLLSAAPPASSSAVEEKPVSMEPQRVEVVPATAPPSTPSLFAPPVKDPGAGWETPPVEFTSIARPAIPNVSYIDNGIPSVDRAYAVAPADGAKNVGLTPTLTGATTGIEPREDYPMEWEYTVCPMSTSSIGSNSCETGDKAVVAYSGWVKGSWKIPTGKLQANTSYKWKVDARSNPYFGTSFSEIWVFATGATLAPFTDSDYQVSLSSPSPQQALTSLTPTLKATLRHATSRTYEYSFEVAACLNDACSKTSKVGGSGWIRPNSWTVPKGALQWNAAYKWTASAREVGAMFGTWFNPSRTFGAIVPLPAGGKLGLDAQGTRVAGVSLADRHFEHAATDASLPALGVPLAMMRSYSSTNTRVGAFGTGWSSVLDMTATTSATGKTIRLADGHEIAFGLNPDGSFAPAPGSSGMKLSACTGACAARLVDLDETTYEFGTQGLTSVTNREGFRTTLTRDTAGKVSAITDVGSGRSLSVTWSGAKVASVTMNGAPAGTPATWTYSYTGDLLSKACRPASTAICTSYGYTGTPPALSTVKNSKGKATTTVTYSGVTVTSVLGPQGTYAFATSALTDGTQVTVTSGNQAKDVYQVDKSGRTRKLTNSRGGVEQWKFDRLGRTLAYQSAQGSFLEIEYSPAGKMVQRKTYFVDGTSSAQHYFYGTSGKSTGKLLMETQPNSRIYNDIFTTLDVMREYADKELEYDSAGRVSAIIRGTNKGPRPTERYTYTTGTETAVGGGVTPKGLLKSVTDPAGKVTDFTYTRQGLLATTVDPLGARTTYEYDWAGRLVAETTGGSGVGDQRTAYTFDDAGRLATTTRPQATDAVTGAAHQLREALEYDTDGFLTTRTVSDLKATSSSRSTAYSLDDFGRILTETGSDGTVLVRNEYDSRGWLTSRRDAAGTTIAYAYSPQGDVLRRTAVGYTDEVSGQAPHDIVLDRSTYDAAGRLSTYTDRAGVTHRYTYRCDDQIAQVVALDRPLADGTRGNLRELTINYSTAGNVSVMEQNGTKAVFGYDSAGRVTTVMTPTGEIYGMGARQFEQTYDARGLVTSESVTADVPIRTTTYDYDAAGNLIREWVGSSPEDPGGTTTTYRRDVLGRIVAEVDPRSTAEAPIETRYTWDALNRATAVTSYSPQHQYTTSFGYDAFGNQTSRKTPSGLLGEATFDAYDHMLTSTAPHPAGGDGAITRWEYTPAGKVDVQTDPLGVRTSHTYDSLGQLTSTTRSAQGQTPRRTTFTYDDVGNMVRSEDPLGNATVNRYDDRGNLIAEEISIEGVRAVQTHEYDTWSNLTADVTPLGARTTYTYNYLHEPMSMTGPDGRKVSLTRDAAGQVVAQQDTGGPVTWINYDATGNPIRLSHRRYSSGAPGDALSSWNWDYDKAGLQTRQIDPLGGVQSSGYDQRGNLTSLTFEDGSTSTLSYDAEGNTVKFLDENGQETTATYTPTGMLAEMVEPAVPGATSDADRTHTWTYDDLDRPIRETLPGGTRIDNVYDIDGMLTSQSATDASGTAQRSFTYDPLGQLTSFSHPAGTQEITYDAAGRIRTSTGPAGDAELSYDLDGNLTSRQDTLGTSTFSWSSAGDLTRAEIPGAGTFEYGYIGYRLTSVKAPSGDEFIAYDRLGNITMKKLSAGSASVQETYTYDAAGNRTKNVSTRGGGSTTTYAYDIRNRLTGWQDAAGDHTVTWDPAGNLTALDGRARTYDARNRLLTAEGHSYTYTPDGRRMNAGATQYVYDAFGQLTSAGDHHYTYDALGRLAEADGGPHTYTSLARDASSTGESDIARDAEGRILLSAGSRVLSDPHGDLIASLDSQGVLQTRQFDPFGNPGESQVVDGGIGYQGDFTSGGLTNMDARWYDPASGTFTVRDDVALPPDQQNRYSYALGNPVRYQDPSGHCVGPAAVACLSAGYGFAVGAATTAAAMALVGVGISVGIHSMYENRDLLEFLGDAAWSAAFGVLTGGLRGLGASTGARSSTASARASWSANASWSTGSWSIPKLDIPKLDMPKLTYSAPGAMSSISFPRISLPSWSMPSIRIPDISIPNISIPNISIPTISIPTISIPTISIPRISIPTISIPEISVPDFSVPSISAPRIDSPDWAYPDGVASGAWSAIGLASMSTTAVCGDSSSAACRAAMGTLGASCASPGSSALAACAPAVAEGLWANEAAAENNPTGSLSSAAHLERNIKCGPDDILFTKKGCESPMSFLQRIVQKYRDLFSSSPIDRMKQLFPKERSSEIGRLRIYKMNNGKALERAVGSDPEVTEFFRYIGGRWSPDFVLKKTGKFYELTTNTRREIRRHLTRPYVHPDRIVTYTNWP